MLYTGYPQHRITLKGMCAAHVSYRRFLLGLLLLGVLLVSGCSFVETYPSRWPAPVISSPGVCPDISGVFCNKGESSTSHYDYLFDKITSEGIWGTHECVRCTVTFQWMDPEHENLQLTLDGWGGILHTERVFETAILKAAEGDFTCADGVLSVRFTEGFEAIVEGFLSSGTRNFFLDEGDSLVCVETAAAMGHVAIVVPFGIKNVRYFRWQQGDH